MELGYARTPLRRELVDGVLRGDKTATAGLRGDEPLPQAGDRFLLLDFDDRPVAVVETTEVRVLRADEVDLQFARDEGEGFESVADWREAHLHDRLAMGRAAPAGPRIRRGKSAAVDRTDVRLIAAIVPCRPI